MLAPERELSYDRVSTWAERCCANGARTIATKSGIRRCKLQTALVVEFMAGLLIVANGHRKRFGPTLSNVLK